MVGGTEALAIIIGYLLGSIPSAYIAGRLVKGVDIRQVGGGNMGALNTMREIGTGAGIAVLVADIAKGTLAVFIARWLDLPIIFAFIAGFAAIVGHMLPVFLKFRGGKGAATTFGVLLALAPLEVAICSPVLLIVILVTSNITLGITAGIVALLLVMWQLGEANSLIFYTMALAIILGLRYMPTAKRGWARAESKKDFFVEKRYKPWQTKKE